ncbi:MAG TPA: NUDIX domain-containing protein [Geobacteraceae bacterium]|nr:NUDIX domain-containing protein [Geobacteraceae bacterium]
MHVKHSHCSFCGNRFPESAPWPRRCTVCGNSSYLNPLPVAVVLLPVADGIVVIRRNTEPQKGTLTLPGGYIDLGETWQEAASRELREETGIEITDRALSLFDVMNGLDGTLVVFGLAEQQALSCLRPFSSAETQEVVLIDRPIELGFTMHTQMVRRYFAEAGRTAACL